MKISDRELLRLISQGNDLAFTRLYKEHWDWIYLKAYNMLRDEDAAKDIVQDVFLSLLHHANINQIRNLQAYLYQVARNRILMQLRHQKVQEEHLQALQQLNNIGTDDALDYFDLKKQLDQCISALPPKCQEVFRMSRYENLSNLEIANRLGISQRTVETHISRAIQSIKANLKASVVLLAWLMSALH